jgi:hypothetical protein
MSTKQRKDKRQKQLIEDGRRANELVAAAKAAQDISDRALAKALDELEGLRSLPAELREAWVQVNKADAECVETLRVNAELRKMVDLANDTIELNLVQITQLTKERDELRAADKDSGKLRRRLQEKTKEINRLQSLLSREKRAEMF